MLEKFTIIMYNKKEYIIKKINIHNKLMLIDLNGNNYSGTPDITNKKISIIKKLPIRRYNNNVYSYVKELDLLLTSKGEVFKDKDNKQRLIITNLFLIKTKVIYSKGIVDKKVCSESPNILFIFGDNLIQQGEAGQAVIRYCNNSFGIPTKRLPSMTIDSFFNDRIDEKKAITDSINNLLLLFDRYEYIAFPEMGLGTGLALMENKSPILFEFLKKIIKKLVEKY